MGLAPFWHQLSTPPVCLGVCGVMMNVMVDDYSTNTIGMDKQKGSKLAIVDVADVLIVVMFVGVAIAAIATGILAVMDHKANAELQKVLIRR